MRFISKVVLATSGMTVFFGTAYVAAVTLAPPPSYTVSNNERIASYDRLSVNNVYEKKTKSQEFYLGLSRWRRKMLREEGLLHGRVLEVGAGCGNNIGYYPTHYFTDDEELRGVLARGDDKDTSYALQQLTKTASCDEIVLCDRSPGMVQSCIARVQARLGYAPYQYPPYDLEAVRREVERQRQASAGGAPSAVTKRKLVHDDGTVRQVIVAPSAGDGDFVEAVSAPTLIAPIVGGAADTDGGARDSLALLSAEGQAEMRRREALIGARQSYREAVLGALRALDEQITRRRERKAAGAPDVDDDAAAGDAAKAPGKAGSAAVTVSPRAVAVPPPLSPGAPQPLFSVANYAAEQLPFPDNSFDTVVDMFGLCSYDNPVRALRELSRVCKPGGKLLLIEHGKGSSARVNGHLDKWAPRHAKDWGCWWNRDIRRAIRLSGVGVQKWESKHFGTSHYIIAKPYKSMEEWDAYYLAKRAESVKK